MKSSSTLGDWFLCYVRSTQRQSRVVLITVPHQRLAPAFGRPSLDPKRLVPASEDITAKHANIKCVPEKVSTKTESQTFTALTMTAFAPTEVNVTQKKEFVFAARSFTTALIRHAS